MPALSTLDTFTDSDKALASHTPDYSDYTWTTHASFGDASELYGNRAVPGNGESVAYLSLAVPDRSTENWGVEGPVYYAGTRTSSYGGLFAGTTGAKTGYVVYWYGGTWALGKYVAGTWTALGTYSESFSTGTSKVVRMRFTSTQVIVSIDGTDRITATDSSITPTRMGVYGDRAVTTADATGFHISDISLVGRAILNPARETDAAVALTFAPAASISCNEYGGVRITVGRLSGSPTLERRPAGGGTWYDITSAGHVAMSSGTNRVIADRRPHYGSGKVDWGGTVEYRLTDGANVLTLSVVADVSKSGVRAASYPVTSTYMAGHGGYVPSVVGTSNVYPGEALVTMALGYLETGTAQYLTDAVAQYDYLVSLLDAHSLIHLPGIWASATYREHNSRTVVHLCVASRLLKFAGATTASDNCLSTANAMAKAWLTLGNGSPTASYSVTGWEHAAQTAWASGTIYPAGAIVRKTSDNNRTYRAMNAGTSGGSEPTWPTSTGGTVSDNGITWKETGFSGDASYTSYALTSPYGAIGVANVDVNQNASEAGMFALLCTDSRSDFYAAGSYRTTALAHITEVVKAITPFQASDGAIYIADNVTGTPGKDTLYCGYTLAQLAIVRHLMGDVTPEFPLFLSRGLNWLETRSGGSTEPITANRANGDTVPGFSELNARAIAARTLATTTTVDKLPYSEAFFDVDAPGVGEYGAYSVNGGVTTFGSGFQSIWDLEAYIQAVLARIDLTPATETDAAVALTHGRAFSITPATETDAAVTVTFYQPQAVSLTPAAETDAAVALSFTIDAGQQITLTPAFEGDEAVALTYGFAVPQEITLTPATENDAAVALSVTRTGAFTMNMRMLPGTVVGAYYRHEWRGSEVPVRGTGSYPGVAVTTATVDDYGEVEFTGLDVGSYIAWAEDYPLRRRFFVMTG